MWNILTATSVHSKQMLTEISKKRNCSTWKFWDTAVFCAKNHGIYYDAVLNISFLLEQQRLLQGNIQISECDQYPSCFFVIFYTYFYYYLLKSGFMCVCLCVCVCVCASVDVCVSMALHKEQIKTTLVKELICEDICKCCMYFRYISLFYVSHKT